MAVKYHWELEVSSPPTKRLVEFTDAFGLRYQLAREGRQTLFNFSSQKSPSDPLLPSSGGAGVGKEKFG